MKKLVAGLLALTLVMGGAALPVSEFCSDTAISASADSFYYGDLRYTVREDSTIDITGYTGSDSVLTIPSEIDGMPVLGIKPETFKDNTTLTEVTIPGSLKLVTNGLFDGCTNLKKVVIESGVTQLSYEVFNGCTSLEDITIPNTVKEIGYHTFEGTKWLADKQKADPLVIVNNIVVDGTACEGTLVIPNGVTSISDSAFEDSGLTDVTIPSSVTIVRPMAFSGTPWLDSLIAQDPCVVVNGLLLDGSKCSGEVTVPSTVRIICDGAFMHNENITKVTIPANVKSVGTLAFIGCSKLAAADLAEGIEEIKEAAFMECTSLTSVTIPKGIKTITLESFGSCLSLSHVDIPDTVTEIEPEAFFDCPSLKSLTIPRSVEKIGERSFGVYYDDTNKLTPVYHFTVRGEHDTEAEDVALNNLFLFEAISGSEQPATDEPSTDTPATDPT